MAGAHADATNAEANTAGKWTVTRATDPLLDTPSIIATLSATPVPGKPELRPSLRVACTDGLLSTSIRWETGTKGGWAGQTPEGIDVLVRLGRQEPAWRRWEQIGRTPVTELDEPDKFITELASHRRLAVRAYPAGTAPATVVFNLSDAGAIMTEVTNACRLFAKRMESLTPARAELHIPAEVELRQIEDERRTAETERGRIGAQNEAEAQRRKRIEAAKKRTEARRGIEAARRREAERALQEAIAQDARQIDRERLALLDAGRMEYIAQIKDKIERNWLRPPGTRLRLKCVVRVSQIPGGEVVQAEIMHSSGNVAFDRSVEDAVLRSSPLPVPKDPSLFDRHVTITFEPEA